MNLVLRWLKDDVGGLAAMHKRNKDKAALIYNLIDGSNGYFKGHAQPANRSLMNVTFRLPSEALEKKFCKDGEDRGLDGLKGHRSVGGIRASIYNAMPVAGVEALADFMRDEPHHVATLATFYQAKRDLFVERLAGSRWGVRPSAGSYFQLLDYSSISDEVDTGMADRLVSQHGVAAIPVSVFYRDAPPLRLLRFCFAKKDETLIRAAELLCGI